MLEKATEQRIQSTGAGVLPTYSNSPDKSNPNKLDSTKEMSQDFAVLRKHKLSLIHRDTIVNVMLVGPKNIGKSSLAQLLQTYKHAHVKRYDRHETSHEGITELSAFITRDDMSIRYTIIDTPGFNPDDKTSLDLAFGRIENYLRDQVSWLCLPGIPERTGAVVHYV